MRFAVIADVHGNRWALEAVLAEIDRRGIRTIVNLGDNLFGPLDREGTAAIMMRLGLPGVSGNQDRQLLGDPTLRPEITAWLASLPFHLKPAEDILCFHGTPDADDIYLLETVHSQGASLASEKEITARLGEIPETLLLCGHTHIPRVVAADGRLIVNPGSVGLQAYADDAPVPHVMETGSPHARFAVLERSDDGWDVDLIQVVYDSDSAARAAEINGRPDWAYRIRTGRCNAGPENVVK